MKKFNVPTMNIQMLDSEEILSTSSSECFETFACKECYCSIVQCGAVTCTGLVCPTLSDYD